MKAVDGFMDVFATNEHYAMPEEDKNLPQGEQTIANKRGRDVIIVRYGVNPIDRASTKLASDAIRSLRRKK